MPIHPLFATTTPILVVTAARITHAQANGLARLFARHGYRLAENGGPCFDDKAHHERLLGGSRHVWIESSAQSLIGAQTRPHASTIDHLMGEGLAHAWASKARLRATSQPAWHLHVWDLVHAHAIFPLVDHRPHVALDEIQDAERTRARLAAIDAVQAALTTPLVVADTAHQHLQSIAARQEPPAR